MPKYDISEPLKANALEIFKDQQEIDFVKKLKSLKINRLWNKQKKVIRNTGDQRYKTNFYDQLINGGANAGLMKIKKNNSVLDQRNS